MLHLNGLTMYICASLKVMPQWHKFVIPSRDKEFYSHRLKGSVLFIAETLDGEIYIINQLMARDFACQAECNIS